MNPVFSVHLGDSFEVLKTFAAESFDACVTDPPYGIRFMGQAWDGEDIEKRFTEANTDIKARERTGRAAAAEKYDLSNQANQAFQKWTEAWASEMFRILKPGAHIVSFASCRTYHRMTCGVEDAGFEIRDQLAWVFGSGFPKSHNLQGDWTGWGTALKPGWEPIVLARKPLAGTVAANVAKFGTGAINIDGCRLDVGAKKWTAPRGGIWTTDSSASAEIVDNPKGRWPSNLAHDGSAEVVAHFPESAGQQGDLKKQTTRKVSQGIFGDMPAAREPAGRKDGGSSARFFYCAKTSSADRDSGLDDMAPEVTTDGRDKPIDNASLRAETKRRNTHPTVKPTELMRWLCRLITPPRGKIIDPFAGSGSTGRAAVIEGFDFVGIEREEAYAKIAKARIAEAIGPLFAAA